MHKLSLVDETFDSNLTFEYNLSIQLSLDGFSFSILDLLQNKVVYLYYQEIFDSKPEFVLKNLQEIYEKSDLLNLAYKNTKICFANSSKQQLIPSSFFNENYINCYQQLAFSKTEAHHNHHIDLPTHKLKLVVSTPEIIFQFFQEKHPQSFCNTNIAIWANQFTEFRQAAFISISKREVSILLFNDAGLCSASSFPWYYESDLLFFILGSINKCSSPVKQIVLSGIVNKFSYIYHQLKSYCNKVSIQERSNQIYYSYLLDKLPDARFNDLFCNL
ncbi:MAG: DUF3822 family protein [Mangrovibacterium sp.]